MASQIKPSSSNAYNLKVLAASCEVNDILEKISPRWKMQILHSISKGINQYSLLKEAFPSLSDQVMGRRVCEMVKDGLLRKEFVKDTVPQQVIYIHTKKAAALLEIIALLHQWGLKEWEEEM